MTYLVILILNCEETIENEFPNSYAIPQKFAYCDCELISSINLTEIYSISHMHRANKSFSLKWPCLLYKARHFSENSELIELR